MADSRAALRRGLYRRLKRLGLGQDALARAVPAAARDAQAAARLSELVVLASAVGPVCDALAVASPGDPALAAFEAVLADLPDPVSGLVDRAEN